MVKSWEVMRRFWIAVIGAFLLLGIVFLLLGLVKPTPTPIPVRAGEFEDSIPQKRVRELISLAFPQGLKVAGAKTPFKVTHRSEEKTADFNFNALGAVWESDLPEGDEVSFEVRFRQEMGGWGEWQKVEEEDDLKEEPPPGTYFGRLLSAGDAKHFQYRAIFTLKTVKKIPSVPKIKLIYIDSRGEKKERGRSVGALLRDALLAVRSFFEFNGYEVQADSPSADVPMITRSGWGADESYRFDKKGDEIWTRSYRGVKKMIVHHTVFNDPNPKVAVRAIYYYHAKVYGWSDIGYNFLIDRSGNIYEGRYGGDGVVAGHALRYNWGSVGVAVLGDFRYDNLNNQIRNALDKIAVWKFTRHGVDPTIKTHFIDRTLPAAFGHGEVLTTACPGNNLQKYVPTLRSHARFIPQEIVVRFKPGTTDGSIANFAKKLNLTEASRHPRNVRRFRFGNKRVVSEVLRVVSREGTVSYSQANYIQRAVLTPDDPEFPNQWSLTKIKAAQAWDISPGGSAEVTVAVIDTGVAYENYADAKGTYAQATDFGGTTFTAGYDFINHDSHANDDHGHGTAVASIIAATTNNSLGIAGIAYASKVMPVKVLDRYGYGTDVTVADGIYFAVDNGAKVLNLSLGGSVGSPTLRNAVSYAVKKKGASVVAAAGNQGIKGLLYPARYDEVIAVGASDLNGDRLYYSNYGTRLDLLAPGGDLNADLDENGTKDGILLETLDITTPGDYTQFKFSLGQGTSFAAPHVSAAVALMVSQATIWPQSLERFVVWRAKNLVLDASGSVSIASATPPYLNGTLIRALGQRTVYLVEDGKRRKISNPRIFETQFRWENILPTDEYTVSTYPLGAGVKYADGTLLKGSTSSIYVMSNEQKRKIGSPTIFGKLGYRKERILTVSDDLLAAYPNGLGVNSSSVHPDGSLVRGVGSSAIYLVEAGKKRKVPNPAIFNTNFVRGDYILSVSSTKVAGYPKDTAITHGGGAVIKGTATTIYLISDGQKCHIKSPAAFHDLGFSSESIITVKDAHLDLYPTGNPIR